MVDTLAAKDRKLVVIIDPHVKVDPEYAVYKGGEERKLFMKSNTGDTYVGKSVISFPVELY